MIKTPHAATSLSSPPQKNNAKKFTLPISQFLSDHKAIVKIIASIGIGVSAFCVILLLRSTGNSPTAKNPSTPLMPLEDPEEAPESGNTSNPIAPSPQIADLTGSINEEPVKELRNSSPILSSNSNAPVWNFPAGAQRALLNLMNFKEVKRTKCIGFLSETKNKNDRLKIAEEEDTTPLLFFNAPQTKNSWTAPLPFEPKPEFFWQASNFSRFYSQLNSCKTFDDGPTTKDTPKQEGSMLVASQKLVKSAWKGYISVKKTVKSWEEKTRSFLGIPRWLWGLATGGSVFTIFMKQIMKQSQRVVVQIVLKPSRKLFTTLMDPHTCFQIFILAPGIVVYNLIPLPLNFFKSKLLNILLGSSHSNHNPLNPATISGRLSRSVGSLRESLDSLREWFKK